MCRSWEPEYEPPEHGDGDDWEASWRRHAYLPRGTGNAECRPRREQDGGETVRDRIVRVRQPGRRPRPERAHEPPPGVARDRRQSHGRDRSEPRRTEPGPG